MREREDLRLACEYFDALRLRHRPPTPKPFQSLVHGDARKPCRETGLGPEALQMRKGLDVGFLHGVFGFAVTSQDAARDAVKPPVVTLDDGANCSRIASERLSHQRLIVQRAGNFELLLDFPSSILLAHGMHFDGKGSLNFSFQAVVGFRWLDTPCSVFSQ